jgi:transcriptional regulator with XRE-family HTH domain
MASNTLHLVAAAAGARQYAEKSYRDAIREAAQTCSQADIARAAGVTRQSIQAMLKKAEREPTIEEMEARAAELELWQEKLLDRFADYFRSAGDRSEQSSRNRWAKVSRKYNLANPTVREDRQRQGVEMLAKLCEERPSEPTVKRYLAVRRELLALRERIETLAWPEWARD